VLCSDGLTRHVKPHEIAEISLANPNPDVASQKLVDLANARGGEDNVSVIVISVEGDGASPTGTAEAAKAIEDDDDTLVLKDRVMLDRVDLPGEHVGKRPPDPVPADEDDEDDDTLIGLLSDEDESGDTEEIIEHDPLDEAIATRPPSLRDTAPKTEADSAEGMGEGRDTLAPEQ
jgi:hypothetical protein